MGDNTVEAQEALAVPTGFTAMVAAAISALREPGRLHAAFLVLLCHQATLATANSSPTCLPREATHQDVTGTVGEGVPPDFPPWVTPGLLLRARQELGLTQSPMAEVVTALISARERHGLQYAITAPDGSRHAAGSPLEFYAVVDALRNRYGADAEFAVHTARPNA